MLTLRAQQMDKFREVAVSRFADRMTIHLKKLFPGKYEEVGEERIRQMIRYGIERAASYAVVTERGVCQYIELMFRLGDHFDKDPKLPWASEILNAQDIRDPGFRMKHLIEAALEQGPRG